MQPEIERQVRQGAGHRCEYCHMNQRFYTSPFQIDHIIARQHGGTEQLENLAFACMHCNLHKGPNIAGIDPLTASLTALYNPRNDDWSEHFQWQGGTLVGLTAIGRATVIVLAVNDPDYVAVRQSLILEGQFPSESQL
jgi:hypothetical protein